MKKTGYLILCSVLGFSVTSCDENDPENVSSTFKVTIQNVFEGKSYFISGTTDAIGPGESYSFSFHAGKGHHLSFATMFVQSNDLFYAPDESGLALYNDSGNPTTGDVTAMIDLWDAGTEVNEEPGIGANQAPRQSGSNTGIEENGTVQLLVNTNDGFSYPMNDEVIQVNLEHDGKTMFTVTLNNVSNTGSFQTPLAPGAWVVHNDSQPLFTVGNNASEGLENLSEDGQNSILMAEYSQNSGYVSPFAPGIWAIHTMNNPIFTMDQTASMELESLAEDGDPTGYTSSLEGKDDLFSYGAFNTPLGGATPAPIFPNESYEFEFTADEGSMLSLATMLVQSNDLFIGGEINLFENGVPISGDITNKLMLWDAYTETNEHPGAGNNQPPRQSSANTGESENGTVGQVSDVFSYPTVQEMVKVSISTN